MQGTILAYTAMVLWGDRPPPLPIIEDDLQDDHRALIGPPVMNTITLTATIGMPFSLNWWFIWILMLCLSERNYPKYLVDLAASIDQPQLPELIRWFLYQQLNLSDDSDVTSVPLSDCQEFNGRIFIYHSVITQFYTLSDLCGAGGMYHRYIHSTPLWQGKYPHCDTIFITTNSEHDGFLSMCVGRVHLFFSFVHEELHYPCALVHWFVPVSESVHNKTGQWVVELEYLGTGVNHQQNLAVVHVDSIAHDALLSPVFGDGYLPDDFHFSHALDAFCSYFVNSYANHHTHEFIPKTG